MSTYMDEVIELAGKDEETLKEAARFMRNYPGRLRKSVISCDADALREEMRRHMKRIIEIAANRI